MTMERPEGGVTQVKNRKVVKRPKVELGMTEVTEQCEELGKRIAALPEQPDLVIGLANGGIFPSVIAAQAAGIECRIIKVRRTGSRIKQRMRFMRKLLRYAPFVMEFSAVKSAKRSFDSTFNRIEVGSTDEADFDVKGLDIMIVDDCVDSGSTVAHVQQKLIADGATNVRTAVISWGTKYDSMALHGVEPDLYLTRTIDSYPWTLQNPHYEEFLRFLEDRGFKIWV